MLECFDIPAISPKTDKDTKWQPYNAEENDAQKEPIFEGGEIDAHPNIPTNFSNR